MIDDLDNRLNSVAEQMAEKEERIFYQAAKEKAEAIIFVRDKMSSIELATSDLEDTTVRFGFQYQICDSILEVKGAKTVFDSFEFVEIPAYLHRMAEEADSFYEFQGKFKYEHPSAIEESRKVDSE